MGMVSFRVDDDVMELFDKQAAKVGVSRSVWLREVCVAAAVEKDAEVVVHSQRAIAVQARQLGATAPAGECVHPKSALRDLPFSVVCGLCGGVVRRK